ncbi:MAG: serine/threonine-protein kinase [Polyangiaceae bacterium]
MPTRGEDIENDELVGRTVGKYKIVRLLGVGGMGRVYEAVHETLGKRFALKFIDRQTATPEAVSRFHREAQAASAVESSHIVEIFDVAMTDDGLNYIVMELLRGEDLGHRLRRLGRLELAEALRISAQVLRGLARAHDAGIVHRDLKPDNVFLVERDDDSTFAKVLDFGVSKIQKRDASVKTITREGVVVGTPVYMAPEQAQALSDVDARADLWAVGCILYECLTGRTPHSGPTYESVIVNICTKDIEDVRVSNPGVPSGISAVIKRVLSRDREQRYQTARDFLDALVAESDGVLPVSMKSDSLRKAVIRISHDKEGPRTLAAVSTVAATPAITAGTPTPPPAVGRRWLVVGAGVIAAAALFAGAWLGKNALQVDPANPDKKTRVVVLSGQTASAASAPTTPSAPVEAHSVAVSAPAVVSQSAATSALAASSTPASASSSVSSARPRIHGSGGGLELKLKDH